MTYGDDISLILDPAVEHICGRKLKIWKEYCFVQNMFVCAIQILKYFVLNQKHTKQHHTTYNILSRSIWQAKRQARFQGKFQQLDLYTCTLFLKES